MSLQTNERAETFERFCCAVENFHDGERDKVADYLRDIEARLGRDIAERVKTSILACAKSSGAGLEMSKGCALSPKERELMQIFGRLPFSFECDWDKRLEPAA
jgi:hypothetical protein